MPVSRDAGTGIGVSAICRVRFVLEQPADARYTERVRATHTITRQEAAMKGPMPAWMFRFMEFMLALRDVLISPRRRLASAGVRGGSRVLDFGCGPGTYSIDAARVAGQDGRVYALDIHPLAARRVEEAAAREGLSNISTIVSDGATGLEERSVDVILFYDTIHLLDHPEAVLREMYRVLAPGGTLSVASHFMRKRRIVELVSGGGLFEYRCGGYASLLFTRGTE